MQIDDPHGIEEILPSFNAEQAMKEELEFRVIVLSFIVQMYGNMIQQILAIRATKQGMWSKAEQTMLEVYQHQMNLCQKLAVRANKRYERLAAIAEVKRS